MLHRIALVDCLFCRTIEHGKFRGVGRIVSALGLETILPEGWARPPGMAHGIAGDHRRVLLVAGQLAGATGADAPPAGMDMAEQFAASLGNVVAVVRAAGGEPSDIASLSVFLTDIAAFKRSRTAVAAAWRHLLGRHYPAMTMVEVRALFEETALVEINATGSTRDKGSPMKFSILVVPYMQARGSVFASPGLIRQGSRC